MTKQVQKKTSSQNQPSNRIQGVSVHQSYSGPIPNAQELQRYEEIYEGAAKEIVGMAKSNQNFFQSESNKISTNSIIQFYLGQIFAFALGSGGLYVAWCAIQNEMDIAAAMFGVAGLGGVISTFLGKKQ